MFAACFLLPFPSSVSSFRAVSTPYRVAACPVPIRFAVAVLSWVQPFRVLRFPHPLSSSVCSSYDRSISVQLPCSSRLKRTCDRRMPSFAIDLSRALNTPLIASIFVSLFSIFVDFMLLNLCLLYVRTDILPPRHTEGGRRS